MSKKVVLIVDDEQDIRELVAHHLVRQGFLTSAVASGEEALTSALIPPIDLIILDLMLPGISGLDVSRRLKNNPKTCHIPIILLTARSAEQDIVAGLEAGADDYVVKPFSPKVLVARVRALLRDFRREGPPMEEIRVNDLVIDAGRREVSIGGQLVTLTFTEFQVLKLLAERPGWVYDRDQIVKAVRGDALAVATRSVDVQIVGLRKKLGPCGNYIETVRGVGYRLCPNPSP